MAENAVQKFRIEMQEKLEYFFNCYNCKTFPYFDEIYKCNKDLHLICVDCRDQGCPCSPKAQLLRSEMTEEVRAILVTKCKHPDDSFCRKKGVECLVSLPPMEMQQHDRECEYRLVHCPALRSHKVPYNEFLTHFQTSHK